LQNRETGTISDLKSKDRLEHSFQEDSRERRTNTSGLVEHPLKGLKAVMLSIDWKITDSTMDSLLNEIKNVEFIYSETGSS